MFMNSPGNENCCQERENVRLQKRNKQLKQTNKDLPNNAAKSYETPEPETTVRGLSNKTQNHCDNSVTAHNVCKQTYSKHTVLDEKPKNFDAENPQMCWNGPLALPVSRR